MQSPLGVHHTTDIHYKIIDLKPYAHEIGGKSYIDVRVQDDTSVDYIILNEGKTCALTEAPLLH